MMQCWSHKVTCIARKPKLSHNFDLYFSHPSSTIHTFLHHRQNQVKMGKSPRNTTFKWQVALIRLQLIDRKVLVSAEDDSSISQSGEGPSRGLFRDCKTSPINRLQHQGDQLPTACCILCIGNIIPPGRCFSKYKETESL